MFPTDFIFCFLLTGSEEKTLKHFLRDAVHKPNADLTTLMVLLTYCESDDFSADLAVSQL